VICINYERLWYHYKGSIYSGPFSDFAKFNIHYVSKKEQLFAKRCEERLIEAYRELNSVGFSKNKELLACKNLLTAKWIQRVINTVGYKDWYVIPSGIESLLILMNYDLLSRCKNEECWKSYIRKLDIRRKKKLSEDEVTKEIMSAFKEASKPNEISEDENHIFVLDYLPPPTVVLKPGTNLSTTATKKNSNSCCYFKESKLWDPEGVLIKTDREHRRVDVYSNKSLYQGGTTFYKICNGNNWDQEEIKRRLESLFGNRFEKYNMKSLPWGIFVLSLMKKIESKIRKTLRKNFERREKVVKQVLNQYCLS